MAECSRQDELVMELPLILVAEARALREALNAEIQAGYNNLTVEGEIKIVIPVLQRRYKFLSKFSTSTTIFLLGEIKSSKLSLIISLERQS